MDLVRGSLSPDRVSIAPSRAPTDAMTSPRGKSPSIRRSRSRPSAPLNPLVQLHQDNTLYIGSDAGPCYVEKHGGNVVYAVESNCSAKLGYTKPMGADSFFRCMAKVRDVMWVAETDGTITIRDVTTSEVKKVIETNQGVAPALSKKISNRVQVTLDDTCTKAPGHIMAFEAVGDKVWAGSNDGKIHIYSAGGQREQELKRHAGPINCLAERSGRVWSGSADFKICEWDAVKETFIRHLHGHKMAVRCLLTTESTLYSGSDDKTIAVWSTARQPTRQLTTISGHRGDVLCLQCCAGNVWSGSVDCSVRVWNPHSGECLANLPHHTGWVHIMKAMGARVWSASHDGSICIWSGRTLSLLHRIDAPHAGLLHDLAVSDTSSSTTLWSVGGDQVVRFWNVFEVNRESDTQSRWDELEFARHQSLASQADVDEYQGKQAKLVEMLETAHNLLVNEKREKDFLQGRVAELEGVIAEKDDKIQDMVEGYEKLAEQHSKMRLMSNAFRENVQNMIDQGVIKRDASQTLSPQQLAMPRGQVAPVTPPAGAEASPTNYFTPQAAPDRTPRVVGTADPEKLQEEIARLQNILEMRNAIIESLREQRGEPLPPGGQDHLLYDAEAESMKFELRQTTEALEGAVRQLSRKCGVLKAVLPLMGDDAGNLRDLVEREAGNFGVDGLPTPDEAESKQECAEKMVLDREKEISRLQFELDQTNSLFTVKVGQLKAHLEEREEELRAVKASMKTKIENLQTNEELQIRNDAVELELAAAVAEKAIAEQTGERLQDTVDELTAQLGDKEVNIANLMSNLKAVEELKQQRMDELTAEIEQLRVQFGEEAGQLRGQIGEAEAAIRDRDEVIGRRDEELSAAEEEKRTLSAAVQRLKRELVDVQLEAGAEVEVMVDGKLKRAIVSEEVPHEPTDVALIVQDSNTTSHLRSSAVCTILRRAERRPRQDMHAELLEQIARLREENTRLTQLKVKAGEKLLQASEHLAAMREENQTLRHDVQHNPVVEALNADLAVLTEEAAQLRVRLEVSERRGADLDTQLEAAREGQRALTQDLEAARCGLAAATDAQGAAEATLARRVEDVNNEMEILQAETTFLREENANLKAQAEAQRHVSPPRQSPSPAIAEEVHALKRDVELQATEIEYLKSEHEAARAEVARLEQDNGSIEREKEDLLQRVAAFADEVEVLRGEKAFADATLSPHREADLLARVQLLEEQLDDAQQQCDSAELKNKELKEQLGMRVKMIEEGLAVAKEKSSKGATAENERLQEEVTHLRGELEAQVEGRDQLITEVQLLKQELSIAKSKAEVLSMRVNQMDEVGNQSNFKELEAAHQTINELYAELRMAQSKMSEVQEVEDKLDMEKDTVARLERDLDAKSTELRELRLQQQLQAKEVELYRIKLRDLQHLHQTTGSPLRSLHSPSVPLTQQHSRASSPVAEQAQELRSQVDEAKSRAAATQKAAEELRDQTRMLVQGARPVRILRTIKFKSGKMVAEGSTGHMVHPQPDEAPAGTLRVKMDEGDVLFDFKMADIEFVAASPPRDRPVSPIPDRQPVTPPPREPSLPLTSPPPAGPSSPQRRQMVRLREPVTSGSSTWSQGTWAQILQQDGATCALQMLPPNGPSDRPPAFAHGVSLSKVEFTFIPQKLYVSVPLKPPAGGCYVLVDGVLYNNYPVWSAGSRRVRTNQFGAWMIGEHQELNKGVGWAVSKNRHEGVLPHLIQQWQTFADPADPWTDDPTVSVTTMPAGDARAVLHTPEVRRALSTGPSASPQQLELHRAVSTGPSASPQPDMRRALSTGPIASPSPMKRNAAAEARSAAAALSSFNPANNSWHKMAEEAKRVTTPQQQPL